MTATHPPTPAAPPIARIGHAAPFWMSLLTVPLAIMTITQGGWWVISLPLFAWGLFTLLDALSGLNLSNEDPDTPPEMLFWYRLITMIWFPIQSALLVFALAVVPGSDHLTLFEKWAVFFGLGVVSGAVGIVYAHELIHQKNRLERWLGDLLLASVLYSHFRTEHLLVHHRYVGTVRDAVTARYNEGFHRFFPRVLRDGFTSALRAEAERLEKRGKSPWSLQNPFWRYAALQGAWVTLALALGGVGGVILFCVCAFTAIWQLELTNYIEHYGLTRKHLGDGRYEHVKPRHSWNASHRASNWLLINLQRHSDHHYKPDRRFPLLQTYAEDEAPQLPYGYPLMTQIAMIPPLWRRVMNPRVKAWRKQFYPEIADWRPYRDGTLPPPR
ncbi:MAG: alkane 1-monooxygenase [Paracoccaceae bacterium]|nr:alkane 1-monooxygenase [Paracoccaceae bacterium]